MPTMATVPLALPPLAPRHLGSGTHPPELELEWVGLVTTCGQYAYGRRAAHSLRRGPRSPAGPAAAAESRRTALALVGRASPLSGLGQSASRAPRHRYKI